MSGILGGGKTSKPPSRDDSEAKEQQRRRAIAQANQRGRASTVLGSSLGSSATSAAPQRKTALGG